MLHNETMAEPAMAAPSEQLEKELFGRVEEAGRRASELEHHAREWRAVEAACGAALSALKEGRRDG